MKKNDICLVVFLIFLSAAVYFSFGFFKKSGDIAVIYVNGEEYARLPLSEDTETDVLGTNVVCVSDGSVFMKSATCPDKVCMHQAPLSTCERDIVCMPNRVSIRVISDKTADADIIAR